jgi:hypothetical protein
MPTLDDAPTISPIAAADLAGSDLVQVFSDALRKPKTASITSLISANSRLTGYGGILSTDTISSSAAASFTVVNRVTVLTGGTTCTLTFPAASGTLREVIIINSNSGSATAPTLGAGLVTIVTTASARFLSNGTSWYRVS